jgi:hypothetical protein
MWLDSDDKVFDLITQILLDHYGSLWLAQCAEAELQILRRVDFG